MKSSGSKTTERFQKVFVCPDRSEEERDEQRRLAAALKKKFVGKPGNSHFNFKFIRDERGPN